MLVLSRNREEPHVSTRSENRCTLSICTGNVTVQIHRVVEQSQHLDLSGSTLLVQSKEHEVPPSPATARDMECEQTLADIRSLPDSNRGWPVTQRFERSSDGVFVDLRLLVTKLD